jgi:hypothetical protein
MLKLWDGITKSDKQFIYSFESTSNQPTSWLTHYWSTFGVKEESRATSDSQDSPRSGLGGSHHLPPYSIICASLQGLHPNGFLSRDSQGGLLKLPRFGLPQLCGIITSRSDLWSGWGMKQSCSSRWHLSSGVLHVTCTHEVQVDSRPFFLP